MSKSRDRSIDRSRERESGLYILDILTTEFGHDKIGLYRDDGLGCFQKPGWSRF